MNRMKRCTTGELEMVKRRESHESNTSQRFRIQGRPDSAMPSCPRYRQPRNRSASPLNACAAPVLSVNQIWRTTAQRIQIPLAMVSRDRPHSVQKLSGSALSEDSCQGSARIPVFGNRSPSIDFAHCDVFPFTATCCLAIRTLVFVTL